MRSVVKSSEFKAIDYGILKRLTKFLKPYKKYVALVIALSVTSTALGPLRPYLIKIAIDDHIGKSDWEGLLYFIILIFAVLILHSLFQFLITYIMQWVGQKVLYDLRDKTYSHIHKMNMHFFDKNPIGRLVTRVTNDIEVLNQLFSSGIVMIVVDLLLIIWLLFFMFYTSVELTLYTLIILPALFIAAAIFRKRIREAFRSIRMKVSEMNSFLSEFVSGIITVKIFNQERNMNSDFDKLNEEHYGLWKKSIMYYALFFPLVEMLSAIALGIVLWFTAKNYLSGEMTIGVLIAFTQFTEMFFRPVRDLTEKYTTIQSAMAASERVFDILDNNELENGNKTGTFFSGLRSNIEFRNVGFSYDGKKPVLNDLSFSVNKGETIALIGATGAGKTSIINLLYGFYDNYLGEILIDGEDIRKYKKQLLYSKFALVMQEVFLFSRSIRDNISLGGDYSDEQIRNCCEELGAGEYIERLSNGYNTVLNERGSILSTGQRQLLSFCRAYIREPDILILDEATSNIDSQSELIIEKALNKLIKSRTSIVIAHRLSTIKRADRILTLHKGKIVESGSHKDLLRNGGLYSKLYKMQYKAV